MFETLSDIFIGVAMKYLTASDVEPSTSNQHEIGGLVKAGFAAKLGHPTDGNRIHFQATLAYIDDFDENTIISEGTMTWYDSRSKTERNPELRLYYQSNQVTNQLKESDFMVIALTNEQTLLLIFCPQGSNSEVQMRALFGARSTAVANRLKKIQLNENSIATPIRLLLSRYGIEIVQKRPNDESLTNILVKSFGGSFPKTRDFSTFARSISDLPSAIDDPDAVLVGWMNNEEHIFRLFERHIVQQQIEQGFEDVEQFIRISLSIQNRRKSRVGHAFENHIEEVLRQNKITFERGVCTEGKQKPDFLFPGHLAYHDETFDRSRLRMLGAKTTCKERWRQVLAEANQIERKHLITLEPAVSSEQTNQMRDKGLQLVVPVVIQTTYKPDQQEHLMSFKQFIAELSS
jgi:hypothetical protein